MSGTVKYIKLKRSDNYGFGFSILGGAGSELPPLIYDVIEGSPAFNSNQLSPGDIILEINGQDVLNYTTKEVLNCLRLSTREVILKLKSDNTLKEKVRHLRQTPNNSEILRSAITQNDLQGVKQILAKKSEVPTDSTNKTSLSSSPQYITDSLSKGSISSVDSSQGSIGGSIHASSQQQQDAKNESSEQRSKTHKSENDVLTGDLILDLSRSSQTPATSFPSQKLINNVKKSTSMPTSPNDKDGTNRSEYGLGSPHSLCSPSPTENGAVCGSFIYPLATALVRISKSEDYLQHQKDNMSSVNIDLDDDVTSSLNTLLDTRDDDDDDDEAYPFCLSGAAPINPCALINNINNDDVGPSTIWTMSSGAPLASSSPPDSSEHSSHDSDSPLIHSLTPVSPQSPTSSMQYSCSGIYNKMCSTRDSLASSNRSENVCSNSSSLTSPDTDVPDELEWDDTTPTFSPTNHIVNGFNDKNNTAVLPTVNGHSGRNCSSPTDSSVSENFVQKIDENRIIIKVAGPEKVRKRKPFPHRKPPSQDKEASVNGDPDRTPTNTPPQTPGSGTLSPETLAYQQLWESEDEITCLSEKSDESNSCASANKCQRPSTCATSPPLSEDESDIESLHSFHYSPKAVDIPSAVRLAKRLFALDGFKKSDVSRHLSKNNEFSRAVAEEYLRYFNFSKDTLDIALRKFLDKFCLSGETQERERVLVHFSKRYLDCNPGQFNSQDAVHTLTCALMLLNTDLHNQNIGRKMTCLEFIENLAELNDGENFQTDILKALYCAIRSEPLKWAADEEEEEKVGKGFLEEAHRVIGNNPFLSTPIGSGVVYKKGYIMRKCCVEPSGKKTAFGKRSWKMWFCVIQDLVLYLHKDEQGARRGPPPQMGQNALRLHHALAQKAHDYSKKEHVFRLQTADQAEYLLQTSDSKELQAWIDAINFVAASLSAPPMPGAVGSLRKFQRPLLPCSITKLNVVEQLEDHVARVNHIESELNDLKINPLDKNAKSATVSSFKEKEAYLTLELRRYQCYVYLLRSRLESAGGLKACSGSSSAVGANPLPVFDGVEVKEVGPEEAGGDPAVIVPPPIPERSTRHTDSNEDVDEPEGVGEGVQDIGIQTLEKKKRFPGRAKKDEFQKELDKMIKEKEKKDKKKEKQEKKELADTLKRKAKEKKNEDKDEDVKKEINESEEKEKDVTENGNDKQDNQSPPDDPRMGTFNRVSALFKFSKLNRRSAQAQRVSSTEEEIEQLKKDQTYKEKEVDKIDTDIITFPPEQNDINENKPKSNKQPSMTSELPSTMTSELAASTMTSELPKSEVIPPPLPKSELPPPLPPKPGPNSAIMKNLGTRVINA